MGCEMLKLQGFFEIEQSSKYFFRMNLPFNTWAKSLKLEAHQISLLYLLIPSDFWVWNPRHIYIKNIYVMYIKTILHGVTKSWTALSD